MSSVVDDGNYSTRHGWQPTIAVGESIKLPPDPHFIDSLGGNHRLETAVADLVDNSIDAGARRVLIRFVVAENRVASFYVVDDGRGMTRAQIDAAMTVGGVRKYGDFDLGHFGLGLKAASFSHADSLTVISLAEGSATVGRRWLSSKAKNSFECDIVGYGFACQEMARPWEWVEPRHRGTIVRWDDIRAFPSARNEVATARFIHDSTTRLQHHLGLVFHRFLEAGRVAIGIDMEDADTGETGLCTEVEPINPFGYVRSGASDYPKTLAAQVAEHRLDVVCHVWPGRSQSPSFKLRGLSVEQTQGLYVYRHDRLLQPGGWNNVETPRRDLQLARVSVDLSDELIDARVFRMNPEKSHVEGGHEFSEALVNAKAGDETTFNGYLDTARAAFKTSNQRTRTRAPIVPLGRGVPPRVRRSFERELAVLPGYEQVELRWTDFAEDVFFEVDRDDHTIWLNNRYRHAVTGRPAAFNDAPLIKTMLFLLVESMFHGAWLGPKEKDNLELWQTLLTAAVKEQQP